MCVFVGTNAAHTLFLHTLPAQRTLKKQLQSHRNDQKTLHEWSFEMVSVFLVGDWLLVKYVLIVYRNDSSKSSRKAVDEKT